MALSDDELFEFDENRLAHYDAAKARRQLSEHRDAALREIAGTERIILYDRHSGVTIDEAAMKSELEALGLVVRIHRYSEVPSPHPEIPARRRLNPDDDPMTAEVIRHAPGKEIVVDDEEFPAHERIEGLARLLRRVLPEPARVLASMTPGQFDAYQGAKAPQD